MKTIKFRIWCKVSKKYHYNWTKHIDQTEDNLLIWEQFTGLYDKNGKEIYDGDIIDSFYYYDYEEPWGGQNSALDSFRGKIQYDDENAYFYINSPTLRSGKKMFDEIELKETKIIGNVNETPNLIN
jgi:uncharacterized phage protein (TIGR01671 family)